MIKPNSQGFSMTLLNKGGVRVTKITLPMSLL